MEELEIAREEELQVAPEAASSDEEAPEAEGATPPEQQDAEGEPAEGALPAEAAAGGEEATAQEEEDDEEPSPDAPEMTEEELVRRTSALVFASPEPISPGRVSRLLGGVGAARVRKALEVITQRLDQADLGIQLREIAGGTTYLTTPDLGPVVSLLVRSRSSDRVSPAALETLAVVAYRQPVTKAEIEAIRGVQAGPILRTLVDRGLIRVTGRADVPGHPLQYGTTKDFLDRFGLGSLSDLPRDAELARD